MKRASVILAVVGLVALVAGSSAVGAGRSHGLSPRAGVAPRLGRSIDGVHRFAPAVARAGRGASSFDCTASAAPGATNTQLDCDTPLPNNEPHIAVDPTNPLHVVASSNDYDQCCDAYYTTFDGGATWSVGNMSHLPKRTGSDPVTAFDPKHGTVIHASLNYGFLKDGEATNGDVVASISTDGGLNWATPVVVYPGHGADNDPVQVFNDKEWITTDTNPSSPFYGRTYMTWTRFLFHNAHYQEAPIWESHSDDGGYTWSAGQEISGSGPFCTFQTTGVTGECDEDQFSVPAIAPDGTVYVSFEGSQNTAAWETGKEGEGSYLVVKSTDGGATWSSPIDAADMEDGKHDLPMNADGRQTVSGYQLRLSSIGNLAVGPTGKLFLTFADNRAGAHDLPNPVSNMNIYMTTSTDGGATWSAPFAVDSGPGDQWFPWADVNPVTGQVGVLYNDRDPSNPDLYRASLATDTAAGFTKTTVSVVPSDPTNSLFFQAHVPGCAHCAGFNGDYIGLDYGSDGSANMVWTDMSVLTDTFGGQTLPHARNLQFIFFARR